MSKKQYPQEFRWAGLALGVLIVSVLAVLPLLDSTEDSTLFTLTLMFTSLALAINWNMTGGFAGYIDFGHAVWFGIGAYIAAILMSQQSPLVPQEFPLAFSILIATAVTGLIANLVGRVVLRLSGPYFSIAMLGFFVFTREVVRVVRPLTNGGTGLSLAPSIDRPMWYYIELALVIGLVCLTWWMRRTRFGFSLLAIREDELGAEMRGIDTTMTKTRAFTLSALSTGLFGAMWARQNTFVDPDIAFVETRTLDAVIGTMLGGIGTVIGPVLGMSVLFWLRELLWANFLEFHLILQGTLLALIVIYLPKGVIGLFGRSSHLSRITSSRSIRTQTSKQLPVFLEEPLADDQPEDDHAPTSPLPDADVPAEAQPEPQA